MAKIMEFSDQLEKWLNIIHQQIKIFEALCNFATEQIHRLRGPGFINNKDRNSGLEK